MGDLRDYLRVNGLALSNEILEGEPELHTLVDGIDATLIDLAAVELGEVELVRIANSLVDQTFAARQVEPATLNLMRGAFGLRAQRVAAIHSAGRLGWLRETGTKVRLLRSVETSLLGLREQWDNIALPIDPGLIDALLTWSWGLPDVEMAVSEAYRDEAPSREVFAETLTRWIEGVSIVDMATAAGLDVNDMLGVHTKVLTYALQVNIEQAVSLLARYLDANDREISQAVVDFPEYLRFGVSTPAARLLLAGGVRHRRAAVALGRSVEFMFVDFTEPGQVFVMAQQLLASPERWLAGLGRLVLENTIADVDGVVAKIQQG